MRWLLLLAVSADPMEFTLNGLDGRKLSMASLKGKVVVLDFRATWCEPCRGQHPLYEQVKLRFEDNPDVVFLSIDTDEDRACPALTSSAAGCSRWRYLDRSAGRRFR
jgi:thiol-disulfide isomerase/thioredoxin